MSEELIHVTRGPLVECIHRGDIAVVDFTGKLIYSKGDPYKVTYLRSAFKPLQTLNVFLSGAEERFGFNDQEISIMCASHYGEDFHRKTVEGMLHKMGLNIENLLCGATYSLNQDYRMKQLSENVVLNATNTDCSGKHSGMLAACLAKGYAIEGYNQVDHQVQKDIVNVIAKMCEYDAEKIIIGIDGCTVPVHGLPLYNAALGFARLSRPGSLEPQLQKACTRIYAAMNNAPEMVAGTGGFCTELIKNTHGKLVGKLGAEGVYCIGLKNQGIGIAIKIEDGNYSRAIAPAVMRCLEDLKVLDESELESLESFRTITNRNNTGNVVGEVKPCYHLDKAGE